ncbi:hypothetical protein C8J57DRAFT_1517982 [Mycena rebaudengoi]|nr:hypothetical protein C8J57DRAFT_1517982 [Mycena rebaudengoi]
MDDNLTLMLNATDVAAIFAALPGLVRGRAPASPTRVALQSLKSRMRTEGQCRNLSWIYVSSDDEDEAASTAPPVASSQARVKPPPPPPPPPPATAPAPLVASSPAHVPNQDKFPRRKPISPPWNIFLAYWNVTPSQLTTSYPSSSPAEPPLAALFDFEGPLSPVPQSAHGSPPASSPPPSSPSTAPAKRSAAAADLVLSESEPRRSKRAWTALASVQEDADNSDSDNGTMVINPHWGQLAEYGGGGGGGVPYPRGGDCQRNSAAAVNVPSAAQTVAAMQQQMLREDGHGDEDTTGGKGKGKGKKAKGPTEEEVQWNTNGEPPKARLESTHILAHFSSITAAPTSQMRLAQLLDDLASPPSSDPAMPDSAPQTPLSTLGALGTRCAALEAAAVHNDFNLMISYIEIALHIQWRHSLESNISYASMAQEIPDPRVTGTKVKSWYTRGSRLIYLAATSSMYIVPLIAACLLRNGNLDSTVFRVQFPPDVTGGVSAYVPFSALSDLQQRFRAFRQHFLALPPQDEVWAALEEPMLCPSPHDLLETLMPTEDCVAPEITIRTPINLKATLCPVNPENSQSWTDTQCGRAGEAPVAADINDL